MMESIIIKTNAIFAGHEQTLPTTRITRCHIGPQCRSSIVGNALATLGHPGIGKVTRRIHNTKVTSHNDPI